MKKLLGLLLIGLACMQLGHAQNQVYYQGDRIVVANADGSSPDGYPAAQVLFASKGNKILMDWQGVRVGSWSAAQFLNSSASAYSSTSADAAFTAFKATWPTSSGGGGGSTSVTVSSTAALGSALPSVTDYNGASSITTTGYFRILIENTGSVAGSFTYSGLTYTLAAGEQRQFDRPVDPTSFKQVPLPTLSVNGTSTNIRVIRFPTQ